MKPGGTLILNGDDEYLKTVPADCGFQRIFYGFGDDCQYRARQVKLNGAGTEFTALSDKERVTLRLPVMGKHMVMDALAALAAASLYGISMEQAAKALENFEGFKNRQQIYHFSDFTVIDDTYNASPDSMRAALEVLDGMEAQGKKIAVLANMLELGEDSRTFHRQVGQFAAGLSIDCLLCIGELAEEIGNGFLEEQAAQGIKSAKVRFFTTNGEALPFLKTLAGEGNLLLFKGSNSMKLGELVGALKEQ